jgi:hypothetical protein
MSGERISQEERLEASRQAQNIQKTINSAIGHRLVRYVAPLTIIRPRDMSVPNQEVRYGLELRIEPLVTITDFKDRPAQRIAAALREWAELLNQAAASVES